MMSTQRLLVLLAATAALAQTPATPADSSAPQVGLTDSGVAPAPEPPPPPGAASPADSDTVFVMNRASPQQVVTTFDYARRPANSRRKGYGGCIGPAMGVYALDMRAVHDLVRRIPSAYANFKGIDAAIGSRFEPVTVVGGMLYGGVGNGVRFGLTGAGGAKAFADPDDTTGAYLSLGLGYGGLLVEKSFVLRNLNLLIGGTVGAGGMGLTFAEGDLFAADTDPDQITVRAEYGAGFLVLEGHAGFTYSFLPWLHVGADASVLGFFSSGGFSSNGGPSRTGGFYTANPGGRVRVMLGNIG